MSAPRVRLSIADHSRAFHPGEALSGQFRLDGVAADEVRAVELSVLWHTDGKGDPDMSVHFFQRIEPSAEDAVDFRQPRRFSTTLPNSPLSYDGQIVQICWCVRARVFLARGKDLSVEVPFRLGAMPHPRSVAT